MQRTLIGKCLIRTFAIPNLSVSQMDSEESTHNPRTLLGILAVALFILVFDIPVALLVSSYLVGGFWFFSHRPARAIFTDLLLLEGIVTLAIGLINIGGVRLNLGSMGPYGKPPINPREWRDSGTRQGIRKELSRAGILLLTIGAIFIGMSLLVAFLPL